MSLSGLDSPALKVGIYIQYLIFFAGTIVSIALLWYEMDRNNPLLKKVCTGIKNGNCGAILTSKAAKAFGTISWSEIGFFYFIGATLSITLAGSSLFPILSIVALLNVLAIPYPFYSIYYQWRVAKEWCILCLFVQILLIIGIINVFAFGLLSARLITTSVILQSFAIYIMPVLVWYTARPYLLRLQEAKNSKRQLAQLKYDKEIFKSLLHRQKRLTVPIDGLGIDLGDPQAKNEIIKVCNPYCGPCSKAHPELEKLMDDIPDLKVKIIFAIPRNSKLPIHKLTRHLLTIAATQKPEKTREVLDQWYRSKEKDQDGFMMKNPVNPEKLVPDDRITEMHSWCLNMEIEFTPTIFVNGHQLPKVYNLRDLKYFLLD